MEMIKGILKELRIIGKDNESWRENMGAVALKLNGDYSLGVKAKALWILGEMGLKYPEEIAPYINDIASYLESDDSKLRQRSANAIGQ